MLMDMKKIKGAYYSQKHTAINKRNIAWEFTFETWLAWWGDDIQNRGRGLGKLVQARIGDTGPYSPENCIKLTMEQNISDGNQGRTHSTESRIKRSQKLKGIKRTKEQIESNRQSKIGKAQPQEALIQREITRRQRQDQAREMNILYGYDLRAERLRQKKMNTNEA